MHVCASMCAHDGHRPWNLSDSLYSSVLYLWVCVSIWAACGPYAFYQGQPWLFKRKYKSFNLSAKSSQWSFSLVNVSEKERREEKEIPKNLKIGIFYFDVDVRI